MEEIKLIEQAKLGDKKSMAELVKKYESTVYNFSFKICRDKDRAENTMQETFLSLVKNIKQFKGDSKLSTWLYIVISNHCLMLARTESKHAYTSFEDEDASIYEKKFTDWNVTPDKVAEDKELKKFLDDAIDKLYPDYRVVFLLRDVEGFSTEETAKMCNLSVPAVKSRLHRARAFLRKELNTKFNYEKT